MTTKPIPKIHEIGYVLFDYYTGECLDKGNLNKVLSSMIYRMATQSKSYEDFEVRMIVIDEVKTLSRVELGHAVLEYGKDREGEKYG
jgi:hypothetical protein